MIFFLKFLTKKSRCVLWAGKYGKSVVSDITPVGVVGVVLLHADQLTDITKLIGAFRYYANTLGTILGQKP